MLNRCTGRKAWNIFKQEGVREYWTLRSLNGSTDPTMFEVTPEQIVMCYPSTLLSTVPLFYRNFMIYIYFRSISSCCFFNSVLSHDFRNYAEVIRIPRNIRRQPAFVRKVMAKGETESSWMIPFAWAPVAALCLILADFFVFEFLIRITIYLSYDPSNDKQSAVTQFGIIYIARRAVSIIFFLPFTSK